MDAKKGSAAVLLLAASLLYRGGAQNPAADGSLDSGVQIRRHRRYCSGRENRYEVRFSMSLDASL